MRHEFYLFGFPGYSSCPFAVVVADTPGLASAMPLFSFLNKAQGALEEYAFHDEIIGLESRCLYLSSHGADFQGRWL